MNKIAWDHYSCWNFCYLHNAHEVHCRLLRKRKRQNGWQLNCLLFFFFEVHHSFSFLPPSNRQIIRLFGCFEPPSIVAVFHNETNYSLLIKLRMSFVGIASFWKWSSVTITKMQLSLSRLRGLLFKMQHLHSSNMISVWHVWIILPSRGQKTVHEETKII